MIGVGNIKGGIVGLNLLPNEQCMMGKMGLFRVPQPITN